MLSIETLRLIIDQNPHPIWVSDEKGTLVLSNQALKRFLNVTDEQILGKYIKFAVDGGSRMQQLILDLLNYGRVGSSGPPEEPASSEEALAMVLDNVSLALAETGGRVTHDPLPEVMVRPSQLMPLLQNLLSNAIKFRGDAPPAIHISATRQDRMWRFKVRDNGIGLDMGMAEQIFVVFRRMHLPSEYEGTGIGLAICKKIVQLNGGKIWVEAAPGSGCAFYFTLPGV